MSDGAVVVVDAALWAGWSAVAGYVGHRLPHRVVGRDTWLTRTRRWERGGRTYERLGVRRWKDRVPEAGDLFRGGTSKRVLPSRDEAGLRRFAAETRRAELVHWAIPLALLPMALWTRPALLAAMAAYAVVANVPCIAVQRFNRARVERVLARRRGATGPGERP